MIRFLSKIAIQRPVLTLMFYVFIILTGVISYNNIPVQLFPNLIYPQLFVFCSYPGATPEKVEDETIIPIESEISRLKNIKEIQSKVFSNYGYLSISYNFNVDMKYSALKLQQALNKIKGSLPEDVNVMMEKFDTSEFSAWMMELTVLGEGEMDYIKKLVEERVVPELSSVDGVIDVSINGGLDSEVQVVTDKNRLESQNLRITRVISAIDNFNRKKEYLGKLHSRNKHLFVSVEGEVTNINQLKNVILDPNKNLKLSDVAEIKRVNETSDIRYRVNGKSTLGMTIMKDSQANMLNVSDVLKKRINELNNELADDGLEITIEFNQANILEEALSEIKKLALYGILLAFFILLLFLKDIKIVSIIILAIPISIIFTFNIMYFSGVTLNILSFCGLALALGMLVDNGIVVLENIFRHFTRKESPFNAALNGTSEVAKAITASTFTTISVFLPSIFIQNEMRIILKEFALSIINPLLVSLLVSFTLIPMLSYQILKNKKTVKSGFYGRNKGTVYYRYLFLLITGLRNRGKYLSGLIVLFLITLIVTLPFILTMVTEERNHVFSIYVDAPLENTIDATDRVVKNVENEIEGIEYLKETRSVIREHEAVITVELNQDMVYKDKVSVETVKKDLKKKTDIISGAIISYDREVGAGGGGGSGEGGGGDGGIGGFLGLSPQPESVKVRGKELDKLKSISEEIKNLLEEMDEVENVRMNFRRESPEMRLIGRHDRLAYYDLSMYDIMRLMWLSRQDGISSQTEYKYKDYTIPIKIYVNKKSDRKVANFDHLRIPVEGVGNIPLSYLTDMYIEDGASVIQRRNQQREIEITYNIKGDIKKYKPLLEDTRKTIDDQIHNIYLPKGFTIEIEHDTSNNKTLYWMLGIAAILIYMILASVFESFITPFIIFITIPLAFIGVFWLLLITGTGLEVMALLGTLILLGIIVNNGILLIDYANNLRKEKGFRKLRAITYAGIVRLRPIFMTAGTTVLGILPLAFKTNKPDQVWPPFAIAVLGGLAFGTLFTTVIIPIMYLTAEEIVGNFKKIKKILLPLLFGLYAGSFFIIDSWMNSILWKTISCLFIFGLSSWFIMKLNQWIFGKGREFLKLKEYTVQLRNLTKIYNKPGKTKQALAKCKKYILREIEKDPEKDERKVIKENLVWQLPLTFFIFYLHSYFSKPIWLLLLTIASFFYFKQLLYNLKVLLNIEFRSLKKFKRLRKLSYLFIVVFLFMYLKIRWESNFVLPVLGIILWFLIKHFRYVSKNIEEFKIILKKKRKIKRIIYSLIFKIPFFKPPKKEVTALKHVNIKIEKGMFGLLGPNGAGKTTLMRLVCNIIDESYGSIFIGDINVKEIRESIQKRIGYLPQSFGLYENFTAHQYLCLIALFNGIWNMKRREKIINEVLDSVGLGERKFNKIKSYSGGMKQRLGIARTLLHLPDILVVDEPTAGLDPKERIRFRNLLSEMSKTRIVIFSTHVVEDISSSCNNLAVLNKGELVFLGKPFDLMKKYNGKIWSTKLKESQMDEIRRDVKVLSFNKIGDMYKVKYYAEKLIEKYNPVSEKPSLEDAYLSLLG